MTRIFVVGSKAQFESWCLSQTIDNPRQSGVSHIPNSMAAMGIGYVGEDHTVVVLPSADLSAVLFMRARGFNIPEDSKADAKQERERQVKRWTSKLERWYDQHCTTLE